MSMWLFGGRAFPAAGTAQDAEVGVWPVLSKNSEWAGGAGVEEQGEEQHCMRSEE